MTGRIHIRYIRGHELLASDSERARTYNPVRYVDPSGHEGLICSKKYGEHKKKEAEGGTLSEKEKRQIYEYEQNQKKSNGAGSDSKTGRNAGEYHTFYEYELDIKDYMKSDSVQFR